MLVSSVMSLVSGMIVFFKFPYVLVMFLIILSLCTCFSVSFFYSSLLGLLIFMIYVGGVLVLFLYSLSVLPNEKNVSFYIDSSSGLLYSFLLWLVFTIQGSALESWSSYNHLMFYHYMSVPELGSLFIFMALILLFLMLVVCNLCDKKRVPLRKLD